MATQMSVALGAFNLKKTLVAAAASNPTTTEIAVSGIATEDLIVSVTGYGTVASPAVPTALTATITSAGNITVSDATASFVIEVLWVDRSL